MMTQDHGAENTANMVAQLLDLLADPKTVEKLKQFRRQMAAEERMKERQEAQPEVKEHDVHKTIRGTCPTCGRKYVVRENTQTLRRHGTGKCAVDNQLPAEIIPAIGVIAELGSDNGEQE